jgi:excinuclease ABC subunit C
VVIDGGKGQLSSAVEALQELGIYGKMPIIGIAKRLEEIYFPGDQYPIHLDKKSESLMLLQRIRDEAHRFAITFHRQVRSKKALNSQLTDIEGIGALTAQKLLKEFKSVKKIQMASEEDLAAVIGAAKAKVLLAELAKNKASS